MVEQRARELGVEKPEYIQHTGGDVAILEAALESGRYPCITYAGADGVYYSNAVGHMVNLVYLDATKAAIHDNNFPGKYLWMPRGELLTRWRGSSLNGRLVPNGGGWCIIALKPGPPPVPMNAREDVSWNVVPEAERTLVCGQAAEQCTGPNCPRPTVTVSGPAASQTVTFQPYSWDRWEAKPGHWILRSGNRIVGVFGPGEVGYQPYDERTQTYSARTTPPIALPLDAIEKDSAKEAAKETPTMKQSKAGDTLPTGVEPDKVSTSPAYMICDKDGARNVSRDALLNSIQGSVPSFPGDHVYPRVTAIGPKEWRDTIRKEWKASPTLGDVRCEFVFADYPPDHWAVKDLKYVAGDRGIVVQEPAGKDGAAKVILNLPDYDGAEGLKEALRECWPGRDPRKDPSPFKFPDLNIFPKTPNLSIPGILGLPSVETLIGFVVLMILAAMAFFAVIFFIVVYAFKRRA